MYMRANPGGKISPDDCIGRDQFIKNVWKVLQRQSVVLVAERRSGKTTILQKMAIQHSKNDLVIFRDVGAISQPIEFAKRVAQDIESYLSTMQKSAKRTNAFLKQFGGTKILGFQLPEAIIPHWKDLLESVLSDLAENNDKNVVLLWDELPWMLQKIVKKHGEGVAMDLLDTLRGLRQTYPNLRMIYTGSIGLHHVTTALKNEGYSNSPINDMHVINLPPLALNSAIQLVLELIKGEQLNCAAPQRIAQLIAELTDNMPYYIHHVIAELAMTSDEITEVQVHATIQQALSASHDPWNLADYRTRLSSYYLDQAPVAQCILDIFSEFDTLTLAQLQQKLQLVLPPRGDIATAITNGDNSPLRDMIRVLRRDHYIIQDPTTAAYRFQFQLIRRWWRLEQGLS
ncbi:MAG: hypothetical protein ACI8WB_002640 [Phenylobacterium sp.]|jgi:hypothetical protein